jgi:hypothetical protein
VRNNTLTFEASASTVWDRGLRHYRLQNMTLPEALARLVPRTKLVVATREPSARLWSEYKFFGALRRSAADYHRKVERGIQLWHECRSKHALTMCLYNETMTAAMPRLIVGMYAPFLQRWLQYFPPAQILVIDNDELNRRPREVFARLFRFLDLPDPGPQAWDLILSDPSANVNLRSSTLRPWANTTRLLKEFYAPFSASLAGLLARVDLAHASTKYS